LSNLVFMLAGLHVLGVVVESRRHRENLAAAMLHGNKRAAAPDEVA
jgi:cytochrome b